jgi:hypothetical protein
MSVLIDAYIKLNEAADVSDKLLAEWKRNPSPENKKALDEANAFLRKLTEESFTILRTHKAGIN